MILVTLFFSFLIFFSSRNVNGVQSQDLPTLRSRIVEILAGTANGCLSELGYFPGMPQKLAELERQNAQWQQENVKLFQDNQSLTRALQERKDSQQAKTVHILQTQIQSLLQEKAMLVARIQKLSSTQPNPYHILVGEYNKLVEQHQYALQEIKTLRENNSVLSGRTSVESHVAFNGSALVQQASPQAEQFPASSFPVVPSNAFPTKQAQYVRCVILDLISKQVATIIPSTPQPQSSFSRNPRPGHEFNNLPNVTSRSQPPSRPVSAASSSRPVPPSLSLNIAASNTLFQSNSTAPQSLTIYQNAPMSAPPISQSSFSPVSHDAPRNAHVTHFPPSIYTKKHSLPLLRPMEQSALVSRPSTLLDRSHVLTSMGTQKPATMDRDDINILSSSIDVDQAEEQKSPIAPLPINAADNNEPTSPRPFEAITPINEGDALPIAIVSSPPTASLKRPSLSPSNVDELPSAKKARVDSDVVNDTKHAGQSPKAGHSPAEVAVEEGELEEVEEEEEDSEEEEIRVGPDGLRLVEDCLPALIEDDEESEELKTCKLCTARFTLGYTTEEPKPFRNATTEELIQHCVDEHRSAWDTLRKGTS
ncbi:hypothetical protein H0H93_000141 [Arthromyces matolae]|nr:hypothetical protein H0H93_000141 [Arthromyces matolae]